jgi:hypothetical protein
MLDSHAGQLPVYLDQILPTIAALADDGVKHDPAGQQILINLTNQSDNSSPVRKVNIVQYPLHNETLNRAPFIICCAVNQSISLNSHSVLNFNSGTASKLKIERN